ncbi:hypothetical protein G6F36_015693 [Rhizopus arrhizus]|nr:hypothetical protein G6F36_015693 [Rhizopus arrhizus]
MFPTYFSPDLDMIPEEARSESVLAENQRVASELETLSANIASLELKQNMALMTETFRLQEELQGLRSVYGIDHLGSDYGKYYEWKSK